eukprot:256123-Pyramimonas_sp.AAC.1
MPNNAKQCQTMQLPENAFKEHAAPVVNDIGRIFTKVQPLQPRERRVCILSETPHYCDGHATLQTT